MNAEQGGESVGLIIMSGAFLTFARRPGVRDHAKRNQSVSVGEG